MMFVLLQINGSFATRRTIVGKNARVFRHVHPQLELPVERFIALIARVQFFLHVSLFVMAFHIGRTGKLHTTRFMLAFDFIICFDSMCTLGMPSQMGLGYVLRIADVANIFLQSSMCVVMSVECITTLKC